MTAADTAMPRAPGIPAADGMESPLSAHVTHPGGRVIVHLQGELSGPGVHLLEVVLHRLEKRGRGRLTLDLRDLDAIDAAGVAMVNRSAERALGAGRPISVLRDDVAAHPRTPTRTREPR